MKNSRLCMSLLILCLSVASCSKDSEENKISGEAIVEIPDLNFKNILVGNTEINTNGNSEIEASEVENYNGKLSAVESNIADAEGLQYFINISAILMYGNNLTSIDVSKNTKVTQLLVERNDLTSIDISNLSVLTDFKAHSNELTKANLANGNNVNMTRMEIQNNFNLQCIKVDATPVPVDGWSTEDKSLYNTNCDQ